MSLNRFFRILEVSVGDKDDQNEVEWYGAWIRIRGYIFL